MNKSLLIAPLFCLTLGSIAGCQPSTQPVCQTAAGRYADVHGLRTRSIVCARGDEAPCVMSYQLPGDDVVTRSVTLACTVAGCTCLGSGPCP
jgi:hypothetical protein